MGFSSQSPRQAALNLSALLVLCAGLLCCGTSVRAEDRIVLRSPAGPGRIAISGTILDYRGNTISIRTRTGREKDYDVSEVVEYQTPQTAEHRKGLQLLAKRQYAKARGAFSKAAAQESRRWVRREILAQVVRCSLALGDYATAGSRFLVVMQSDPDSRHFRDIPLGWGHLSLDAELRNRARAWLGEDSSYARLIGASFLLDELRYRDLAKTQLHLLRTDRDGRVAALARMQLWREVLREGDLTAGTLAAWIREVERLPAELRGGPYYVLGLGHREMREYEQAALAFLWLPTVYHRDHMLAGQAELEAAASLARVGQKAEAATLCREIIARFSSAQAVSQAKSLLRGLQPATTESTSPSSGPGT